MNVIKVGETLTVVLSTGEVINKTNCSKELHSQVVELSDDENAVKELLQPNRAELEKEVAEAQGLIDRIKKSKILSQYGDSTYIKSISEVSIPQALISEILEAEENNDYNLLQTYRNFWTFCSCNPDSRARTNLFWFLKKYGMTIVQSGLFVAYRLVNIKEKGGSKYSEEERKFILNTDILRSTKIKKSRKHIHIGVKDNKLEYWVNSKKLEGIELGESLMVFDSELGTLEFLLQDMNTEGETIYTDQKTGKMTIKLGHPVNMPREDCDSVQENTCSKGLHLASFEWLEKNHYFGKIPLKCLCDPSKIVAVPMADDYGKLRACEYYPIQVLDTDENNKLINNDLITTGSEIDFIDIINTETEINNEDLEKQVFEIPNIPELQRERVLKNIDNIKEQLKNKVIDGQS